MIIQVVEGIKKQGIPDKYNMFMVRGDDDAFSLTIENLQESSSYRVVFGVRKYPEAPDLLITKEAEVDSEGKAHITIDASDTADLDFGKYAYDIKLFDDQNKRRTIIFTSDFNLLTEVAYDAML